MKSNTKFIGVILAGGEGKRLRPLTYYFQKCMIPVGSHQKPILEYIILLMKKHGIKDLKFLVGYKREQIINYFNNGDRFGVKINYFADDPSIGGSGGAILNLARRVAIKDEDNLLIYYGDILSDINLLTLIKQHIESGSVATMAVSKGFEAPVGVAEIEGKVIKGWNEKPMIDIYAGIGIVAFSSKVIKSLKELAIKSKKLDLMGDLIPFLVQKGEKVEAFFTEAFWYDLGSTEKYEKLNLHLVDKLLS